MMFFLLPFLPIHLDFELFASFLMRNECTWDEYQRTPASSVLAWKILVSRRGSFTIKREKGEGEGKGKEEETKRILPRIEKQKGTL